MIQKKHILVIPSFYPTKDMPLNGVFFKEQCLAMNEVGKYNIGIIYPELRSIKSISIFGFKNNHFQVEYCNENNMNVLRKHNYNIIPNRYMIGARLWLKDVLKLFEKYERKYGKPDLIHSHCTLWGGYAAKLIKDRYNIPYLITEHSTAFARDMIKPWQYTYINQAIENSNCMLAVSSELKNKLFKYSNSKEIKVVYNMVDTNYFDLKITKESEHFTFLTVCFLTEKKGLDVLIKAFAKLYKNNFNVRLNIGGDGPIKNDLIKLSKNLGVYSQISFLGLLDRDKVREQMKACNVFILSSYVETFGVVLIEALSTGTPVIATKSGGPEDFVNSEVGFLISPGNVEELTIAMKKMFIDYKKFNSQKIRKYIINNFSKENLKISLGKVYDEIIETKI